jgi:hypothetical protein
MQRVRIRLYGVWVWSVEIQMRRSKKYLLLNVGKIQKIQMSQGVITKLQKQQNTRTHARTQEMIGLV